jgi:predicted site-specific integrase-resolvase
MTEFRSTSCSPRMQPVVQLQHPNRRREHVLRAGLRRSRGYARVSTDDQTNALQADAMAQANVDVVFHEEASGANTARPI